MEALDLFLDPKGIALCLNASHEIWISTWWNPQLVAHNLPRPQQEVSSPCHLDEPIFTQGVDIHGAAEFRRSISSIAAKGN